MVFPFRDQQVANTLVYGIQLVADFAYFSVVFLELYVELLEALKKVIDFHLYILVVLPELLRAVELTNLALLVLLIAQNLGQHLLHFVEVFLAHKLLDLGVIRFLQLRVKVFHGVPLELIDFALEFLLQASLLIQNEAPSAVKELDDLVD